MIGEQVGDYLVTGVLGHGTQGTVYDARHVTLQHEAAVKVLLPHLAADPARVARFFDEASAARSVHHRGVVRVLDSGLDAQGRPFIALERLRGETLFDRLRRGPVPVTEAVGIAWQLAEALQATHGHVVHRDLKPENVFLAAEGSRARVVLMDFGIAKLGANERSAGTLTGAGAFGTPPYMSPEQWRGEPNDHRSDLYALGCLLHELVAGTPPFGFGPPGHLFQAHCEQLPPPLMDAAPDVPAGLGVIADRLLAKAPADRFPSCAELLTAFESLGVTPDVPAPPPREVRVGTLPLAEPAGRSRLQRAWRQLLEVPPWSAAGASCAVGSVMLGSSIVLGVGDSYLSAPNWAFTYALLVPLLVLFMLRTVQQSDATLRTLAAQQRVVARRGGAAPQQVDAASNRLGAFLVAVTAVLFPVSSMINVGEWVQRRTEAPLRGAWWAESAVMGGVGAFMQGLVVLSIVVFVVYAVAWAQLLHSWTTPRAPLALRPGDFQALGEPASLLVTTGALVQVVLYLSNAQSIAEARGTGFFEVVAPRFDVLFEAGTGLYASTITLVASAMVAAFVSVALLAMRSAVASTGAAWRWPVNGAILLLAGSLGATVFPRLGVVALVVLGLTRFLTRSDRES